MSKTNTKLCHLLDRLWDRRELVFSGSDVDRQKLREIYQEIGVLVSRGGSNFHVSIGLVRYLLYVNLRKEGYRPLKATDISMELLRG